jgi:hypothetical protein
MSTENTPTPLIDQGKIENDTRAQALCLYVDGLRTDQIAIKLRRRESWVYNAVFGTRSGVADVWA